MLSSATRSPAIQMLVGMASAFTVACGFSGDSLSEDLPVNAAGSMVRVARSTSDNAHPTWILSAKPEVALGAPDRVGEDFFLLRGAILTREGRMMVADGSSATIRVFSLEGEYLETLGRRGDGPAEFRHISGLWGGPDGNLWVPEAGTGVVKILTVSGEFDASQRVVIEKSTTIVGAFSRDTFLCKAETGAGPPIIDKMIHATSSFSICRTDGMADILLAEKRGYSVLGVNRGGTLMGIEAPFTPAASGVVSGGLAYIIDPIAGEVMVFDEAGTQITVIQSDDEPRKITASHLRLYQEAALKPLEQRPDVAAAWRRVYETMSFPSHLPPFRRALPHYEGGIWLEQYPEPGVKTSSWFLLDPTGVVLATVELPSHLRPTSIGTERVIGIGRDDDGAESVEVYRVERGIGP